MEELSQEDIKILRRLEILNETLNLFHLANIEDRYTEKDVICNGCVAIKELLREIQK